MKKITAILILPFFLVVGCTSPSPQVAAVPAGEGRAHNHADHQHGQSTATAGQKKAEKPGAADSVSAAKPYPLDTCIVSDEPLESMGDTIVEVYQGQTIKFCCKGCVKDFHADPDSYLAKL